MTRKQYENMSFEELMNWANNNLNSITNEELLKEYAIDKIQDDNFSMGLHIINAIYKNPYYTEWYRYDYSMGMLETPTPIVDKEDIEDLISFDDEE